MPKKAKKKSISTNKEGVTMPQKKAKKPYQKTKNKPPQKKGGAEKPAGISSQGGLMAHITIRKPKQLDVEMFIRCGRFKKPVVRVRR